jgi:REP element-mobilizing transposase RayT
MKVPEDRAVGFYHCVSRVVDRRRVFKETEKEHFVALMRECEAFCEVRVLTYCLMSNHFHILVQVPKPPELLPTPEQILAKVRRLSGHRDLGLIEQRFAQFRNEGDTAGESAYLERFYARMWDVSAFMKLLKQRFTQWYNGRMARKGTLWEDRFKSVVVEGAGSALAAIAAYVDLNPVRAGLVQDPKDYRWSGYGEATAGRRRALEGLRTVAMASRGGKQETLSKSREVYRMHLFNEGSEEREALDQDGQPVRGALRRDTVLRVLGKKGRLPLAAYLRCRIRYFCDGAAVGSEAFVEDLFRTHRRWFGPKRKNGARKLRGLAKPDLYALRDLRLGVFG